MFVIVPLIISNSLLTKFANLFGKRFQHLRISPIFVQMATKYRKGHELFHLLLFLFRTVLIRQAAMVHKYHWLYFFIPSIFLASAQHQNIYIPNFCYNDRYKGRNQSFWILRIYVYNRERYEKQESFIILDFQHKNCACTKSQGRPWSIPVNKWEFV